MSFKARLESQVREVVKQERKAKQKKRSEKRQQAHQIYTEIQCFHGFWCVCVFPQSDRQRAQTTLVSRNFNQDPISYHVSATAWARWGCKPLKLHNQEATVIRKKDLVFNFPVVPIEVNRCRRGKNNPTIASQQNSLRLVPSQ